MTTGDLYSLLGIVPTATADQIKAAFRAVARRFHPDVNHDPTAREEFQLASYAYEILSDPHKRIAYDEAHPPGTKPLLSAKCHLSSDELRSLPEPQVLYVLVEIMPGAIENLPDPPINLCLVIDRSTSMQGARLDQVKASVLQVIDNLREHDSLTVVAFSDKAETIIPPHQGLADRTLLKAKVSTLNVGGGTEIYQGLLAGLKELHKNLSPAAVNHLMLLTDGRTYGDENECLLLAKLAASDGISVSGLGIGDEWNDKFLDELTGRAGGVAEYVKTPNQVVTFMHNRVRGLGAAFAERLNLQVTLDKDIKLDSAFKIKPEPGLVSVSDQILHLGGLPKNDTVRVLIKLVVPPLAEGLHAVARLRVYADILSLGRREERITTDIVVKAAMEPAMYPPPGIIIDALGKLTQYKMQERAWQKFSEGDVQAATQILHNLGTRLLASGQNSLAKSALQEAKRLEQTQAISEEAQKGLKYGTRALMADPKNAPPRTSTKK